eukprot:1156131-Pelagomonas_calceolata.AAC.11
MLLLTRPNTTTPERHRSSNFRVQLTVYIRGARGTASILFSILCQAWLAPAAPPGMRLPAYHKASSLRRAQAVVHLEHGVHALQAASAIGKHEHGPAGCVMAMHCNANAF